MPYCLICRGHYFENGGGLLRERPHVCPPDWLVRHEDGNPEDARRVYAVDAASAAAAYVEERDRWNTSVSEATRVLVARAPEEDRAEDSAVPALTWRTYLVESEILVNYTARMQTQ